MDFKPVVECINSTQVPKQLSALLAVCPLLSLFPPSEEFINAIIENGIGSEDGCVRDVSFRCLHQLYKDRFFRWGDVKTAILNELGNADSLNALRSALRILPLVPSSELAVFFTSKEGLSAVNSCCTSKNLSARAAGVDAIAPLLIELWMVLDGPLTLEGYIKTESTSDAKRMLLDFKDSCLALYKQFAVGVLGKSDIAGSMSLEDTKDLEHVGCISSYMGAIGHLFRCYNEKNCFLPKWVDALVGCPGFVSPAVIYRAGALASASLYPLLKTVLPRLCSDPYLVISKWEWLCSAFDYSSGSVTSSEVMLKASSCLNGMMIAIAHALPSTGGNAVQLTTGLPPAMEFDVAKDSNANAVESASSRQGDINYINAVTLLEEWIQVHLTAMIQSKFADAVISASSAALEICQEARLAYIRYQISPLICTNLVRVAKAHREAVSFQSSLEGTFPQVVDSEFVGWFNRSTRVYVKSEWVYSETDIDFQRQFNVFNELAQTLFIPVFSSDLMYEANSDILALGGLANSQLNGSFFRRQLNKNLKGVNTNTLSLCHPESTPMAAVIAMCAYGARWCPRSDGGSSSGPTSLVQVILSVLDLLDLSALAIHHSESDLDRERPRSVHPGVKIAQCRLMGEIAMLLLTNPSNQGCVGSVESLRDFLTSSQVVSALNDAGQQLRHVLVASLCRAYARTLPSVIVPVVSEHDALVSNLQKGVYVHGVGRWSVVTGASEDRSILNESSAEDKESDTGDIDETQTAQTRKRFEKAKSDFEGFLHCGLLMLSSFTSCLRWPVDGIYGATAAVQYSCLLYEICRVVLPVSSSSEDPILALPSEVRMAVSSWSVSLLTEHAEGILWTLRDEKLHSGSVKIEICSILAQMMSFLYGPANQSVLERGNDLIKLLRAELFQEEVKDRFRTDVLQNAVSKGLLGSPTLSGEANRSTVNVEMQLQAISCLELLALHNKLLIQPVLKLLTEFNSLSEITALAPVISAIPNYSSYQSGLTSRGRMAGWNVASNSVFQRSILAIQRISSLPVPSSLRGENRYSDIKSGSKSVPSLNRGVTSDMIDAFGRDRYISDGVDFFSPLSVDSKKRVNEAADEGRVLGYLDGSIVAKLESNLTGSLSVGKAIFKWPYVPGYAAISSDSGAQFSFFSFHNAHAETLGVGACCSIADVIGIFDDVFNGHLLRPENSSNDACFSINRYLADVLFVSPDQADLSRALRNRTRGQLRLSPWRVLSGSSEPLTLIGQCSVNPFSRIADVKVVAINSSGFKIPYFSIEVILSRPRPAGDAVATLLTKHAPLTDVCATLIFNETNLAPGCEYLLPGALVERSWQINLLSNHSSIDVTFRVNYTDLIPEDKDNGDPCFELFSSSHYESRPHQEAESKVSHRRGISSGNITAGLNPSSGFVSVYCKPLVIRPIDCLLPYGAGALTAMTELVGSFDDFYRRMFGIPMAVFKAMWSRLSVAEDDKVFKIAFQVKLPKGIGFQASVEKAVRCLHLESSSSARYVAACSRVDMPSSCCTSAWGNQFSSLCAWCFQSLFGEEVCMKLHTTASSEAVNSGGGGGDVTWSCILDIKSSSALLSSAICSDAMGTLEVLLGGLKVHIQSIGGEISSSSFTVPYTDNQKKMADNMNKTINSFNMPASDPFAVDPFAFSFPAASSPATTKAKNEDVFAVFDSFRATPTVAVTPDAKASQNSYSTDILGLFTSPAAPSSAQSTFMPSLAPSTASSINFLSPNLPLNVGNSSVSVPEPDRAAHLKTTLAQSVPTLSLIDVMEVPALGNSSASRALDRANRDQNGRKLRSLIWDAEL